MTREELINYVANLLVDDTTLNDHGHHYACAKIGVAPELALIGGEDPNDPGSIPESDPRYERYYAACTEHMVAITTNAVARLSANFE
jgi:hypothetical protein